ncbi:MAG: AprI/Inh family metalloprotease inhibitor [Pseudolabrys sp.]
MRRAAAACLAFTLAGCAGGPSLLSGASTPAPESMNGRWVLTAPNAPPCGMNFSGSPGALTGTISPEGGCPDRFYLSRHWAIGENGLTISDDDNTMLGTLTFSSSQFSGTSASGTPVKLSR